MSSASNPVATAPSSYAQEEARIRAAYDRRTSSRDSFYSPAHVLMIQELERVILRGLRGAGLEGLARMKMLDVGCGSGYWLTQFARWGARPENLSGIDLLPARIEQARALCPSAVHLRCGNAQQLPFADQSMDLVFQATAFTSILDPDLKRAVAAEMLRVLKPAGVILWYDFFLNNPWNPDVRGIRKSELRRLFPSCSIKVRRLTLAPPIARIVARFSPVFFLALSELRLLCTHYFAEIRKA